MQASQKQLSTIVFIVFISFIGVAIPFPIFAPMLLHHQHGSSMMQNWSFTKRCLMLGVTLAAYPFGQFIGAPLLGSAADRHSKKTILILCLFGSTLGYLATASAVYINSISLIIISRLFTGLLQSTVAIARSMAANISSINKYRDFGLIGVATTFGYITGPIIGGLLADKQLVHWFSYYLPFLIAGLLTLLASISSIFFLHDEKKRPVVLMKKHWPRIKELSITNDSSLKNLLLTTFFLSMSVDTYYEFFPAFLVTSLSATSATIAFYTLALASAVAIGDYFCVPALSRNKKSDINNIIFFTIALTLLLTAMLFTQTAAYLYGIFFLLGLVIAITTTTIVIVISNETLKESQGKAMGLALSYRNLGDTIICLLGSLLLSLSYKLPIILSTCFAALSMILLARQKNA